MPFRFCPNCGFENNGQNNFCPKCGTNLNNTSGGFGVEAITDFNISGEKIIKFIGHKEKIIVPNGIKFIGNSAFRDNKEVREIVLPDGLKDIGSKSFYDCSNLRNINLPNSLKTIGKAAFAGCSNLSSINLPNSLETIGNDAFSGCSNLSNINLPNSLKTIGDAAFYGCSNLRNINLPNSLETIGEDAFHGCSNLRNINLPNSLETIGDAAFYGCSNLRNINLPNSLETIGKNAFYGCSSLSNLSIGENVKEIKGNLNVVSCAISLAYSNPYYTYKDGFIVDKKTEEIAMVYIKQVISLFVSGTTLEIPIWMKEIPYSFDDIFPDEIKKRITNLNLKEGLKKIGTYAFSGFSNLNTINYGNKFPASIDSIGYYAFHFCAFSEVFVSENTTFLGLSFPYKCKTNRY